MPTPEHNRPTGLEETREVEADEPKQTDDPEEGAVPEPVEIPATEADLVINNPSTVDAHPQGRPPQNRRWTHHPREWPCRR